MPRRIYEPAQERNRRADQVKLAIDIYCQLLRRFKTVGLAIKLGRMYVHQQPKNKYYQKFYSVVDWLLDERGEYTNPLKHLLEDYFVCLFKYYRRFGRVPNTNQIPPSTGNKVRFLEYIEEMEVSKDEPYWTDAKQSNLEVRAKDELYRADKAKRKFMRNLRKDYQDIKIQTV